MRKDNYCKWVYALSVCLFVLGLWGGRFMLSGALGTFASDTAGKFCRLYADHSSAYREAYAMFNMSRQEAERALYEQAVINDYILNNDAER